MSSTPNKKTPYYESRLALEQYMFFHYGKADEYLPWPGPSDALEYPAMAVRTLLDKKRLPAKTRALDLGCAVGRTSFELSRHCDAVVGVDSSRSFIRAANHMKKFGKFRLTYTIEGNRKAETKLTAPKGARPDNIHFMAGDAMKLPESIGQFDVVIMLNLIDRLPDPAQCLLRVMRIIRPGGQLIIASPYTWMEAYTPRHKWLGGTHSKNSLQALKDLLQPYCRLVKRAQIPFLIREHARKYQWSMAEGTCWIRKLK